MTNPAPAPERDEQWLRYIASHESSHAIAAVELGCQLERVSIIHDGTRHGHVLHTRPPAPTHDPLLLDVQAELVIGLAGESGARIAMDRDPDATERYRFEKISVAETPTERLLAVPAGASHDEHCVHDGLWDFGGSDQPDLREARARADEATSTRVASDALYEWSLARTIAVVSTPRFQAAVKWLTELLLAHGELDGATATREIQRALWVADLAAEQETEPA